MGARLVQLYEEIMKKDGLDVRVRTAMISRIPSGRAMETPDSPENIIKVENALKQIRAEMK